MKTVKGFALFIYQPNGSAVVAAVGTTRQETAGIGMAKALELHPEWLEMQGVVLPVNISVDDSKIREADGSPSILDIEPTEEEVNEALREMSGFIKR